MYLTQLGLTNFRSYQFADISLAPGANTFIGPNGVGKTNLVEAIQYLASLSSHRVATDLPLIRAGCQVATITAKLKAGLDDDRSLSVAIDIKDGKANKAILNKAPIQPRQLLGAARTVLFAPEDLAIIRGDPAERRRFIDTLITSRWPRLAGVRAEYERALKQKTAIVKSLSGRSPRPVGSGAEQALEVWNQALVQLGSQVVAARLRTLADLAPLIAAHYDTIATTTSLAQAVYQSSAGELGSDPDEIAASLTQAMLARAQDEIARGVCLVGPHRDNILLKLGPLSVKDYASHGEAWSFALALKLSSLSLLIDDGVEPILILDDVFAELDTDRRYQVLAAMDLVDQTLITAAVAQDLPTQLSGQVFKVEWSSIPVVLESNPNPADADARLGDAIDHQKQATSKVTQIGWDQV